MEAVDFFYDATIKKVFAKALAVPAAKTKIVKTQLKDFSGVIGASILGKE